MQMDELWKGKDLRSSFGETRGTQRLGYYMTHIKWNCLKKEEILSILSMAIKVLWADNL